MGDLTGLTICVGYVIPIGCCVTGLCMSGYGCYRYYKSNRERQRRMQLHATLAMNGVIQEQPKLKKDTLKNKIINNFFKGKKTDLPADCHAPCADMGDGCAICLDEYTDPPQEIFIGYVLKCGHFFHFECIWEWLEWNRSCPICREACQIDVSDLKGVSLKQVQELLLKSGVENQGFDGKPKHQRTPSSVTPDLVSNSEESEDRDPTTNQQTGSSQDGDSDNSHQNTTEALSQQSVAVVHCTQQNENGDTSLRLRRQTNKPTNGDQAERVHELSYPDDDCVQTPDPDILSDLPSVHRD